VSKSDFLNQKKHFDLQNRQDPSRAPRSTYMPHCLCDTLYGGL